MAAKKADKTLSDSLLTSLFAWFFACKPIEVSGKYCVMPNTLTLRFLLKD
jgi:hypothetical protein